MMVKFVDRSKVYIHDLHDEDYMPECCTILYIDDYTVKLFHCVYGIGMSDRYDYDTFVEVYHGGELITREVATNLGIKYPIDNSEKLNQLLKWLYS
jgi:hypothetical protein